MKKNAMNSKSRENEDKVLRTPKSRNEIKTVDDILEDLRYMTAGFPFGAVEEAINRSHETVPFLMDFLNEVIADPARASSEFYGHVYALFILAYLREKKALPIVLKLISFPEPDLDNVLGDILTENMPQIIASLYGEDLEPIKNVIEDEKLDVWSRSAALRSLLALVKAEVLERNWVIEYLRQIFSDLDLKEHGIVIDAACNLYPEELYDEIRQAISNDEVDPYSVDMRWVDSVMSMGKKATLEKYLYGDSHYSLVDNVFKSMKWMPVFRHRSLTPVSAERSQKSVTVKNMGNPLFETSAIAGSEELAGAAVSVQQRKNISKTGRNDSCPCGSGKKFKKCCLTTNYVGKKDYTGSFGS